MLRKLEKPNKLSGREDRVGRRYSLTLTGIPKPVYDYRLGNRSALEWVIDQYQVSTDKLLRHHQRPQLP